VKRISAAVLVDYALQLQGEGDARKRVVQPRAPDKMEAIRELVAAAIGLDTARGDQLIVQTLPFEETLQLQNEEFAPGAPAPSGGQLIIRQIQQDPKLLIAAGGVILLLLVAVFFLARRSRKPKVRAQATKTPPALPGGTAPPAAQASLAPGAQQAGLSGAQHAGGLGAPVPASVPRLLSARHESLVRDVQEIVTKDTELSASILHGWLAEETGQ
jgi:flagellar M-ring protein FliF